MPVSFRFTADQIAPVVFAAEQMFDAAYFTQQPVIQNTTPTPVPFQPPPRAPDESDDDYAARVSSARSTYDAQVSEGGAPGVAPPREAPKVKSWDDVSDEDKGMVGADVNFLMSCPNVTGEAFHSQWLTSRSQMGWTAGTVYDAEKKVHPFSMSYADLPDIFKVKFHMMASIVLAMAQSNSAIA